MFLAQGDSKPNLTVHNPCPHWFPTELARQFPSQLFTSTPFHLFQRANEDIHHRQHAKTVYRDVRLQLAYLMTLHHDPCGVARTHTLGHTAACTPAPSIPHDDFASSQCRLAITTSTANPHLALNMEGENAPHESTEIVHASGAW